MQCSSTFKVGPDKTVTVDLSYYIENGGFVYDIEDIHFDHRDFTTRQDAFYHFTKSVSDRTVRDVINTDYQNRKDEE